MLAAMARKGTLKVLLYGDDADEEVDYLFMT